MLIPLWAPQGRRECVDCLISWSTRRSLEWCRIARGSGQPGDFDVPVSIVFAASDRAAWRRSFGIGIGAIVVYGSAPTAHSITAHCPPAHDEDSDALAGAALGSPSVMSKSAICSRRPSENTKTTHKCFSSSVSQPPHLAAHRPIRFLTLPHPSNARERLTA